MPTLVDDNRCSDKCPGDKTKTCGRGRPVGYEVYEAKPDIKKPRRTSEPLGGMHVHVHYCLLQWGGGWGVELPSLFKYKSQV